MFLCKWLLRICRTCRHVVSIHPRNHSVILPGATCQHCRDLFRDHEDNKELAELLEQHHSVCRCEHFSVGEGSPGPVGDDEPLHRIVASPRDYDPVSGTIRAAPFEKVFTNGLSVWRAKGPDRDVNTLLEESLRRGASEPPKHIHAICEALAGKIRRLQSSDEQRLFCIYDQTVCRIDGPDLPPVGTHASIFLRVLAPKGTPGSKKVRKDYAGLIRELFLAGRIAASSYRNGLCASLNYRAGNGEFIRHGEPEGTSPAGVEPGPN